MEPTESSIPDKPQIPEPPVPVRLEPFTDDRVQHNNGCTGTVRAVNFDGTVMVDWDGEDVTVPVDAAELTVINDTPPVSPVEAGRMAARLLAGLPPEPATQPEPPVGSVVLDRALDAWQRRSLIGGADHWYLAGTRLGQTWAGLRQNYGPLTVVYTPPTGEPVAAPTCVACGRELTRHETWTDPQGRGYCTATHDRHRPGAAPVPPPLAVYVALSRNEDVTWNLFDNVGYRSLADAQQMANDTVGEELRWLKVSAVELAGYLPGADVPSFVINTVTLAGTGPTGGA